MLEDLLTADGLETIETIIYHQEDGAWHFSPCCPNLKKGFVGKKQTNIQEVVAQNQMICSHCASGGTLESFTLTKLQQEVHKYKQHENRCLKLLENPTYENIKEAYLVSTFRTDGYIKDRRIGQWAYNEHSKLRKQISEVVKENAEHLGKSLAQELKLEPDNGKKVVTVLYSGYSNYGKKASFAQDEYQSYLVDKLYRHSAGESYYWVMPANFKNILGAYPYHEFEKFDEKDCQTTNVLNADGGIYEDILQAAKVAATL